MSIDSLVSKMSYLKIICGSVLAKKWNDIKKDILFQKIHSHDNWCILNFGQIDDMYFSLMYMPRFTVNSSMVTYNGYITIYIVFYTCCINIRVN